MVCFFFLLQQLCLFLFTECLDLNIIEVDDIINVNFKASEPEPMTSFHTAVSNMSICDAEFIQSVHFCTTVKTKNSVDFNCSCYLW